MQEIKFELVGRNVEFDEIVREVVTLQQLIDGNYNRSTLSSFFDTNNSNCEFIAARRYTGLVDKNGVLIWEGDYIDFRTSEQKADDKHVYLASDDGPPTRLVTYKEGGFEPFATAHNLSEWQSHPKSVDYVVIGNIYENPGLGSCGHSRLTPLQRGSRSQWCCDCGRLFVNGVLYER